MRQALDLQNMMELELWLQPFLVSKKYRLGCAHGRFTQGVSERVFIPLTHTCSDDMRLAQDITR